MDKRDEDGSEKTESETKRDPKFSLNRETVADLGAEEADPDDAASSFSCCVGCNTDGTASYCVGKTGC